MEKQLNELQDDVREIKTALIGNAEMGQKGLVQHVQSNTDYIENDKKFKSKSLGILVGVQFAIGAFLTWLKIRS